jgi:hypothetical protein
MGNKDPQKRQKKIVHELCFVAAGFAPVCGDSPRSLRGEPGILAVVGLGRWQARSHRNNVGAAAFGLKAAGFDVAWCPRRRLYAWVF